MVGVFWFERRMRGVTVRRWVVRVGHHVHGMGLVGVCMVLGRRGRVRRRMGCFKVGYMRSDDFALPFLVRERRYWMGLQRLASVDLHAAVQRALLPRLRNPQSRA